MKIGIHIQNTTPIWGGAYTFESEIISALIRLAEQSRHTFVIISKEKYHHTEKLPKNIENVVLIENIADRLNITLGRIADFIFRKAALPLRLSYEDRLFEKLILRANIDLLWNPSQSTPTMELPYIVTVWDLQHRLQPFFPEVSSKGIWMSREKNFNTTLKRAFLIAVGTETGKAEIERYYHVSPERIKILPLPTPAFSLSSNCSDCNLTEKYGIPEKYLFYPAQFWPHKNHAGILRTLKLLKEKYHIILPVVFAGADKGNLSCIKDLMEQLSIKDQTYILDFVPQEDLKELYRNAFAMLYLSFFGPDNLPPLEAFGLGCPVIAANVPGAEEQLADYALLVNPRSESEIADAVKLLLDHPELREKMVRRGRERARLFTSDDYVAGILSAIDEFEPVRRCWNNSEMRKSNGLE